MCVHGFFGQWEGWDPVNRFNHTSLVAIVAPADRRKSVRNRCGIEIFGDVSVLSRCFLDFSDVVGVFVIGLSQISSFFTFDYTERDMSSIHALQNVILLHDHTFYWYKN